MFYFDGISLSKYVLELREHLIGRKITKIAQYDKYSVSIFAGKSNFYCTVNPALPIVYLTDTKQEALSVQLQFSLVLKKYLVGGIIMEVSQIGFDRILKVKIDRLNELGENVISYMIIELMGKHSNIFLLDSNNKIIDLLKRFSLEENRLRVLIPGTVYEAPVVSKKILPSEIDQTLFDTIIITEKDIVSKIEGFGKYSALLAYETYKSFREFLDSKSTPTIYLKNGIVSAGTVFDFAAIPSDTKLHFDTINEMINYYIENTIKNDQFNTLRNVINKCVLNEIEKTDSIKEKINAENEANKDFAHYKEIGDILAANLYIVKKNQKTIVLNNFYNGSEITVDLNPDISPAENLNRYYKKYNKLKKGYDYSQERLLLLDDNIAYLNSVITHIDNADNINDLRNIEDELIENDYMSKSKNKHKKPKNKNNKEYKTFTSAEGYKIIVGKSNIENDTITFKVADKNDIWLHVKNLPGSHVIIKKNNEKDEVSPETIKEAAQIAALYSSVKNESRVSVDYTLRKNVSKPNGSKPGFVIYRNEKNILVSPAVLK